MPSQALRQGLQGPVVACSLHFHFEMLPALTERKGWSVFSLKTNVQGPLD